MGIQAGSVTFARFSAAALDEPSKDRRRWLSRGFRKDAFEEIDRATDAERSAGWVHLEDESAVNLAAGDVLYGEYALASWRVDQLQVPRRAVKMEVDGWIKEYEAEHGEGPKRHQIREIKDVVHRKFRNQAFVRTRTFDVSWNLQSDVVQIWAASRKVIEEIQIAMESAFSVSLTPLTVAEIATQMGFSAEVLAPTAALVQTEISASEASGHVRS